MTSDWTDLYVDGWRLDAIIRQCYTKARKNRDNPSLYQGDYKYRFIDMPNGWFGVVELGWPSITNLRLDPFERAGFPSGGESSLAYYNYFVYEFWRFVESQQKVEELVLTFVDYPPMQDPASFNLDAIKKKIEKMRSLGE